MNSDSTVRTIVRLAHLANQREEMVRALQDIALCDEPIASGRAMRTLLELSINPLPDHRVYTNRLYTVAPN